MSEISVENLLKRVKMLEEDQEYKEALNVYNRILEMEPENETAYKRSKAIKNNTLIIKREQFPLLSHGAVTYYLCIDGEKIDSQVFAANTPPNEYNVKLMLGKHRIAVWEVGYSNNASTSIELLAYDFEMNQPEQTLYLRFTKSAGLHFSTLDYEEGTRTKGCYVATAVYGSYDCPEVWTLRRYRDNILSKTFWGRTFIHIYYSISPLLVKWFGNKNWFNILFRPLLNRFVMKLNIKGISNTPYKDN